MAGVWERLLRDASAKESTKQWLAQAPTKAFWNTLWDWRELVIKDIKTVSGLVELGRLQGKLEVIDRILELKRDVDSES